MDQSGFPQIMGVHRFFKDRLFKNSGELKLRFVSVTFCGPKDSFSDGSMLVREICVDLSSGQGLGTSH